MRSKRKLESFRWLVLMLSFWGISQASSACEISQVKTHSHCLTLEKTDYSKALPIPLSNEKSQFCGVNIVLTGMPDNSNDRLYNLLARQISVNRLKPFYIGKEHGIIYSVRHLNGRSGKPIYISSKFGKSFGEILFLIDPFPTNEMKVVAKVMSCKEIQAISSIQTKSTSSKTNLYSYQAINEQ